MRPLQDELRAAEDELCTIAAELPGLWAQYQAGSSELEGTIVEREQRQSDLQRRVSELVPQLRAMARSA